MSERTVVLSAIDAVIQLNKEAEVSSDTLTALKAVSEGRAFLKFCKDILTCIHGCFSHFNKVLPSLAKARAHRDFHQARLHTIPALWQSFTSSAGLLDVEPLNLQAVSRQVFDHCMQEFFTLLKAPLVRQGTKEVRLLADEENVIRYASGYIGMKLLKELRRVKGHKAAQYKECLSDMSRNGDDTSFYAYTTQWIDTVNRGGLSRVDDVTFEFFRSMEVKSREVLPYHLAGLAEGTSLNKEGLIKSIVGDEIVQLKWRPVAVDVVDEEDANELLTKIVEMWVTMRGFALTSKWLEDYKRAKDKLLKKSKNLRKELKTAEYEDI